MFKATFIAHQGWLFRAHGYNLLIDPLLTERFGHGGLLGQIYPPRELDLAAFPPIDALVLSHEHDDHFDIPSLHRLDRRIPIYLSSAVSHAGRDLLRGMGFQKVLPLNPGREHRLGPLRLTTFAIDHRGPGHGDEWEVYPFVLRDDQGDGSFASSIDVPPPTSMLLALPELAPRPGIWCYANNFTSAAHQRLGTHKPAPASDRTTLVSLVLRRYAAMEREWGQPAAAVICGAGWSFTGTRRALNHAVFPLDSDALARSLAALAPAPEAPCLAATPGLTLSMRNGELVDVQEGESFIKSLPREHWPARDYRPTLGTLADYQAASGQPHFDSSRLPELLQGLADLARFLYAGPLFRSLHSLSHSDSNSHDPALSLRHTQAHDRRPALALRLRSNPAGGAFTLRYEPRACAFVPCECTDPVATFVSGIECWASDLLALLRGELSPSALCYAGRLRTWNHAPSQVYISPDTLWHFAHPLRRPEATAALYRRLLAAEPETVTQIAAALVPS